MALIHEGNRLKKWVETKKVLMEKLGLSTPQALNYNYRQERLKQGRLKEFCEAIGITLDEFYRVPESIPAHTVAPASQQAPPDTGHQGEKLKSYAEEKGFIIEALAEQLGVSRQTLYQWFKKPALDENAVNRLLQKMEPPPPFLLGSTGQPSLTTILTEIRTVKALLLQLLKKENLLQG